MRGTATTMTILAILAAAGARAQCAFDTHTFSCASGIDVGVGGVCTMTKKVTGASGCTGDYVMELGVEKLGTTDNVQVSPGFLTCAINPTGSYGSTPLKSTVHCQGNGTVAAGQTISLAVRVTPGEPSGLYGIYFWGQFQRTNNAGGVGTHSWSDIERINAPGTPQPRLEVMADHFPDFYQPVNGAFDIQRRITVTNVGTAPTTGEIVVTLQRQNPDGAIVSTLGQTSGAWTCNSIDCRTVQQLAPGGTSQLDWNERVSMARGSYRLTATATGGGAQPAVSNVDEILVGGRATDVVPSETPKKVRGRKR